MFCFRWSRRVLDKTLGAVVLALLLLPAKSAQNTKTGLAKQGPALPPPAAGYGKALVLLRQAKTQEARAELNRLLQQRPDDPELHYQVARAHLLDFYSRRDPHERRLALSLALEALENVLRRNPDHIDALKAKAVIHARAELLHYHPDLAYRMASRVAELQPHAHEYLVELSEWLSGEVRFTGDNPHRVPHDPLLGLDRAIALLDRVVDRAMPYSNEESAALFLLGKALARRGNFPEAALTLKQLLARPLSVEQKIEVLREMGVAYYRLEDFNEAARHFYEALQLRHDPIDRWLLRVALDQLPAAPPLPENALFPLAALKADTGQPPSLQFENIAPELGLNRLDGNGTCAWGDVDGDGQLDVVLAGSGTFLALYRNQGRRFREITSEAGLGGTPSGYSLNLVDYDNDGRLDLYVALNGWSGPMNNRLFRNLGGRFADVTETSGAGDPGSGFVSLWGDLDNDGALDFVVANGVLKDGSTPQVYRNNRDGTFTNVTKSAGINEPPTYGAIGIALGDYDRDGDLDLLINGLDAAPNRLYRNEGGWRFREVAAQAGVLQPPHNGFVCFFLDYNNDGWPDILTTSLAPWPAVVEGLMKGFFVASPSNVHPDAVRLFRNNGDGTFRDVTFQARLYAPMGVMGAGVADLDNDGYVDLYFGNGDPQMTRLEPNRFFRNRGDGTFDDLTWITGFARMGNKGHGVAFVDWEDDGDLDVYAQLGGHYPGDHAENAFYRNLAASRNHWLEVELIGTQSNRYGVGATVLAKAGGWTLWREVKGGEGFGATNPYRVHFGLGPHTLVDSLEVRWPSGKRQTFSRVRANQVYKIREDRDRLDGVY